MFDRFVEDLGGVDEISVEQAAKMQGRQMNMILGPKKEQV
jgi:translation initiation factor IF-3